MAAVMPGAYDSDQPASFMSYANLLLSTPREVTVEQGGRVEVTVALRRQNLEGPVLITFNGLPPGISVLEGDYYSLQGTRKVFHLQAEGFAPPVSGTPVVVTITGNDDTAASKVFLLTVRRAENR